MELAGDAIVSGKSITSVGGLDSIRPLMGVCPQFDTSLCALLTGKEHLQLFARIKGVPPSLRSQEINQLLEEVKVNVNPFVYFLMTDILRTLMSLNGSSIAHSYWKLPM